MRSAPVLKIEVFRGVIIGGFFSHSAYQMPARRGRMSGSGEEEEVGCYHEEGNGREPAYTLRLVMERRCLS